MPPPCGRRAAAAAVLVPDLPEGGGLPAAVVKVQVKQQTGAQFWLGGGEDGPQLVEAGGEVSHIDLGVVLIFGEMERGGFQHYGGRTLGLQRLAEVPVGLGERLFRAGQHIAGQAGFIVDHGGIDVAVGIGAAQPEIIQAVLGLPQIGTPHGAVAGADGAQRCGGQPDEKHGQQQKEHGETELPYNRFPIHFTAP